MERFVMTTYRYRDGLSADDLRELTTKFTKVGNFPGTLAHYTRLDGRGGFTVSEFQKEDDQAAVFENTIAYGPWIDFEIIPVTTMADALPSILKLYG